MGTTQPCTFGARLMLFALLFCFTMLCYLASVRSAVIGEIDEEEDSNKDLSTIRAEPLKPVTH